MFKKGICLFLLFLLCNAIQVQSQSVTKVVADKKRATWWKPASGQYYFSHLMVFAYENKQDQKKGQVSIYLDPSTGALCFERDKTFGSTAKFYDYILVFPDGQVISCGIDEAGKKYKVKEKVVEFKPDPFMKDQQEQDFKSFCIPTGSSQEIFGWRTLEYQLTYPKSELSEVLWLAPVPFNVFPLYGFGLLEGTASLPVSFDFIDLIGPNQLITNYISNELSIKLVDIQLHALTINTAIYKELKLAD